LLNLAGQFHSQLNLTEEPAATVGEFLISIGPTSESRIEIKSSQATSLDASRLAVVDTGNGRRIFDRTAWTPYPIPGD
jgi:hypothetical protein